MCEFGWLSVHANSILSIFDLSVVPSAILGCDTLTNLITIESTPKSCTVHHTWLTSKHGIKHEKQSLVMCNEWINYHSTMIGLYNPIVLCYANVTNVTNVTDVLNVTNVKRRYWCHKHRKSHTCFRLAWILSIILIDILHIKWLSLRPRYNELNQFSL